MNETTFKAILIGLLVISIICTVVSVCAKKKAVKYVSAMLVLIPIIISIIPYFNSTGIGDMVVYYGNAEELEKMENEYAKAIQNEARLENDIQQKDASIEKLNKTLSEQEEEISALKESSRYNATFKSYNLYNNGQLIPVNSDNAFAVVNNQLYFSENVIASLMNNTVNKDEENSIMYLGKYPEETVDLLSACEPYDASDGFSLGNDKPYKVQAKTYSDGFSLDTYRDRVRTVCFNLGSKYTELTFNIGHVDETDTNGTFILTAYLEKVDNKAKQIICDTYTSIETEQTIPLNNARVLILEWRGEDTSGTTYGLTNIRLK